VAPGMYTAGKSADREGTYAVGITGKGVRDVQATTLQKRSWLA